MIPRKIILRLAVDIALLVVTVVLTADSLFSQRGAIWFVVSVAIASFSVGLFSLFAAISLPPTMRKHFSPMSFLKDSGEEIDKDWFTYKFIPIAILVLGMLGMRDFIWFFFLYSAQITPIGNALAAIYLFQTSGKRE
jgi:hypothetical protein